MGKGKIIALIIAGVMLFIGLIVTGASVLYMAKSPEHYTFANNRFSVASSYGTKEKVIAESFDGIEIEETDGDVYIGFSDDDKCHVVYPDSQDKTYEIGVTNGILTVSTQREGFTMFSFRTPKLQILLPEETYASLEAQAGSGDIRIANGFVFDTAKIETGSGEIESRADVTQSFEAKASSGDVDVAGLNRGTAVISTHSGDILAGAIKNDTLTVTATSGDIELNGIVTGTLRAKAGSGEIKAATVEADDVEITTSSGDIECADMKTGTLTTKANSGQTDLHRVLVDGLLKHDSGSGEIEADATDAGEIEIRVNSGDVELELLSDRFYEIKTNSGSVYAPQSTRDGGMCRITTTSGDVRITVTEN